MGFLFGMTSFDSFIRIPNSEFFLAGGAACSLALALDDREMGGCYANEMFIQQSWALKCMASRS